jgi:hypothetical protein
LERETSVARWEAATPHRRSTGTYFFFFFLVAFFFAMKSSPPFVRGSRDLRVAPNGARRSPYLRLPAFLTDFFLAAFFAAFFFAIV